MDLEGCDAVSGLWPVDPWAARPIHLGTEPIPEVLDLTQIGSLELDSKKDQEPILL